MKRFILIGCLVLLLVCFVGCGKAPEAGETSEETTEEMSAEEAEVTDSTGEEAAAEEVPAEEAPAAEEAE